MKDISMVWVIIGVFVLLGLYLLISYNRLVGMNNRIKESFSTIDVYLEQRFDTLTKSAEVVVSYAKHEKETLEKITELRQSSRMQTNPDQKIATYNEMDKMLGRINVQVENYPELKADQGYIQLQRTINDLEEKLSASRRTYNANVTSFNTMIGTIPTNFFASMMGFTEKSLLEIESRKKEDVDMRSLLRS
jgi:LemA protein